MADTIELRGAGGVVFTFDLPLSEAMQDQFDRGHLLPVDEPVKVKAPSEPEPVKAAVKKAPAKAKAPSEPEA